MSFIIPRIEHRLDFFKKAIGAKTFADKQILDYGGNRGNLLADGIKAGEILQKDYTCLDASRDAVDLGRDLYPDAHWIMHNSLNWQYNPTGIPNKPFPLRDDSYDLVLAYSVHTHSDYNSLLFDLSEMYRVCKPGGVIATTILTPDLMEWFIYQRKKQHGKSVSLDTFRHMETFKLYVNGDIVVDQWDKPCQHLLSVYNPKWLLSDLEYDASIIAVPGKKRIPNQPVLLIRKIL